MQQSKMIGGKRAAGLLQRYLAWLALLDFSEELAIAGLRAQGLSASKARATCRQRGIRSSREHQRASRRIVQRLTRNSGIFQRSA